MRLHYALPETSAAAVVYTKGDNLLVLWEGKWHPATFVKADASPAWVHIKWTDGGEKDRVRRSEVKKAPGKAPTAKPAAKAEGLVKGDRVEYTLKASAFKGQTGTITEVLPNGSFMVRFDKGGTERRCKGSDLKASTVKAPPKANKPAPTPVDDEDEPPGKPVDVPDAPPSGPTAKYKANDPVLARWVQDGKFYLAKIVSITGDKAVVKWTDGGETDTVPLKYVRSPAGEMSDYDRAFGGDDTARLIYLRNLWTELNKTKFGGQLRMPHIGFMRSVAVHKFRNRGYWRGGTRQLHINRHVFNNEFQLYETLLHEMCHQAVGEIDRPEEREKEQGHGPLWKAWMVKVGLEPNRYDDTENFEYMTEEQKEALPDHEQKRVEGLQFMDRVREVEGEPLKEYDLSLYRVVKWISPDEKKWHIGLLAGPEKGNQHRWDFVEPETKTSYMVPKTWFYPAHPDDQRRYSGALYREMVDREVEFRNGKPKVQQSQRQLIQQYENMLRDVIDQMEQSLILQYGSRILTEEDRHTMMLIAREEVIASFKAGMVDAKILLQRGIEAGAEYAIGRIRRFNI